MLVAVRDQVIRMVRQGWPLEKVVRSVKLDNTAEGVGRHVFIPHVYRMVLKHEKLKQR